jgi:shikimate kinase
VVAEPGAPHLVFVGLAGSGKTTVGRGVAERLGRPFLDLDQEIIRREGKATVGEVFRARGEAYFRRMETELTSELAGRTGMVISPGGGWIMNPGTLEALQRVAYLIYLKVSPEIALARIGAEVGNRPLLDHPNPVGELRRQLESRGPKYEHADLIVNSEQLTIEEIVEAVVAFATSGRGVATGFE